MKPLTDRMAEGLKIVVAEKIAMPNISMEAINY
jgi:hypothetical protein